MATEIIEYRWNRTSEWVKSAMAWTSEDIMFLNKVSGYEKYRVRYTA